MAVLWRHSPLKYFSSFSAVKIGEKRVQAIICLTNDCLHSFFANFYCSERWKVLYYILRGNGPFSKILAVERCLIQNHFSVFIWVKANLAWHNAYALMRLECKRCDILDCACKMIFAEVASRFEVRLGK